MPLPVARVTVGEVAALLVIVIVALEETMLSGLKMTSNEAVPEGARTIGRVGKFPSLKFAPAIVMEFTASEPWPAFVMVAVILDDVRIATLPKATGLGATATPSGLHSPRLPALNIAWTSDWDNARLNA